MLIKPFMVFIMGIAVGAFLNIAIFCSPKLANIPGEKIKKTRVKNQKYKLPAYFKYLLMGIVTGIVFVLLYYRFLISVEFMLFAYLMSILIAVFFVDLYYKIIPGELVAAALLGSAAAFIYNIFVPFGVYGDRTWWNPLAGILPGAGFLFLIAIIGMFIYKNDDVLGMGDVKIFVPIGIFLGWRMCTLALLISVLAGGLFSFLLIITGLKNKKDTIPFGPFIVIATFITIMWGWDIIEWYFSKC